MTRIHGKQLACHAPRGGNTSLSVGMSQTYCYWQVTLSYVAQCQYHYIGEGTYTLCSMADTIICTGVVGLASPAARTVNYHLVYTRQIYTEWLQC